MGVCGSVDWAATGGMLQGLGTLLGAIAVLIAAAIGSNTFKSWRRQKLAERAIEQAERILIATYNVRRALMSVRSPAIFGYENARAEDTLKENGGWEKATDEGDRRKLTTLQVYFNRLEDSRPQMLALDECRPLARALFSEALETTIDALSRHFWTVNVYARASYRDRVAAGPEFQETIDSTIWTGWPSPEENKMDQEIAEQIATIERICLPVLRAA